MSPSFLIVSMLVTGSINTLTKKAQFQTCCPSLTGATSPVCPPFQETFNKPWTQNMMMFLGETILLIVFWLIERQRARQERNMANARIVVNGVVAGGEVQQNSNQRVSFYRFALPAMCDVFGTGFSGVGMNWISASVWQMMRGSIVVFTSLLSYAVLGRRFHGYHWCGVGVVLVGLTLVGLSSVLDAAGALGSNVPLGIFFTILGQMCTAIQFIIEEVFLKKAKCHPCEIAGSEGVWGLGLMSIVLFVMYWIPGNDNGSFENVVDSVYKIVHTTALDWFIVAYILSIAVYNYMGMTIAKRLSSVHRTLIDTMRTALVWLVQLLLFYYVDESYGNPWGPHSYLQLIGFAVLLAGTMIYNSLLKLPFLFEYSDASHEAATAIRSSDPPVDTPNTEAESEEEAE